MIAVEDKADALAEARDRARRGRWLKYVRTPNDDIALQKGYYFDRDAAVHVLRFFRRYLRHSKGRWAGKRFNLLRWQRDHLICPLFGWKRSDGLRRFRKAFGEIPKKNGKSTIGAGIGLYLLVGDGEPGAEVYAAATEREQASIVWGEAANMVRKSPALRKHLEVLRSTKRIVHQKSASLFRPLAAEAQSAEGLNIHGLIPDELHAWKDNAFFDALWYGHVARDEPMYVCITTAGTEGDSLAKEMHDYALRVQSGDVEDLELFVCIYGAPKDADWTSPATWREANPSLGKIINEDELGKACQQAQDSPRQESVFRRYRLNQWVDASTAWFGMDVWDASAGPKCDPKGFYGQECFGALDLSRVTDMTAFVQVFPTDDGCQILPHYWITERSLREREKHDTVPYRDWIRQGLLEVCDGSAIDFGRIRERIVELAAKYKILEVAVDRWQAEYIGQQLMQSGLEVVAFGQGFASMTAPSKKFEEWLLAGTLWHGGHPILRWNAGHVVTEEDASENIKPSKKKSTERIDGIVATIMAIGRMIVREEPGKSVYETRGILTL